MIRHLAIVDGKLAPADSDKAPLAVGDQICISGQYVGVMVAVKTESGVRLMIELELK